MNIKRPRREFIRFSRRKKKDDEVFDEIARKLRGEEIPAFSVQGSECLIEGAKRG